MDSAFRLFPTQGSTMAQHVDTLLLFLLGVSGFFTLVILVLIVYFALRYRRTSPVTPPEVKTDLRLELTWTIVPLILAMVIFGWGAKVYLHMFDPPANAEEIYVIGKQWMWKIQHPDGRREIDELHVPVGVPIKLVMSSQDVIHDFFIPAFRIKHDVLPQRSTALWFTADRVGEYHLFCSQYCGAGHAGMVGRVIVMQPADYQAWLAGTPAGKSMVEGGSELYAKYGCNTCHGERAPTLAGLYGSTVQLSDGSTVMADDNYLRESILNAPAKIVAGYPALMPSFRGQISDEQLNELVAYIKSLRNTQNEDTRKP